MIYNTAIWKNLVNIMLNENSDTKYVPCDSIYMKYEYNKIIYCDRSQHSGKLRDNDCKQGMRASSRCCSWSPFDLGIAQMQVACEDS